MAHIQLFAVDSEGNRQEIRDLYWFEEQGIHDFAGEGHYMSYRIELAIDGQCFTELEGWPHD